MPAQGQAKRRSVTQESGKPVKRTRVSRACDQCRVAREKCDGAQPTCSTCSTSKRGCTYTTNPKKRGIQPGYIRVLELALVLLFQQNPDNEKYLNNKLAREQSSSILLSRDSKESNKLHKQWRKARFYRDVDTLLSGGEPSRHDPDGTSPPDDDEDSEVEEATTAPTIHDVDFTQAVQIDPASPRPMQVDSQVPALQPSNSGVLMSLPIDSWKLFDTYFTYTQCWLPICEKHDILKLSYAYPAQGLQLSAELSDSGSHAELWSVLAVASIHYTNSASSNTRPNHPSMTPKQLYDTTRSLIPGELGSFDLGHVKALLNLSIFDIAQSLTEAAWVLVGCASRVLEIVDNSSLIPSARRMHIFGGCLVLDGMLALQLGRRPYFSKSDIEQLGRIDEDGLEEWQPWLGSSHAPMLQQSRVPLLAFSSFRHLMDVLDILIGAEVPSSSGSSIQEAAQRIRDWEVLIPPKLEYLRSGPASTPLTPPAVLLQITHYCAMLSLSPSQPRIQGILELLERSRDHIGLMGLPPVLQCLMKIIRKHSASLLLDHPTQTRIQKLQTDFDRAWRRTIPDVRSPPMLSRHSITTMQMPTPDSISHSISNTQPLSQQLAGTDDLRKPSTQLPGPASDMQTDAVPHPEIESFLSAPRQPQSDPSYADVPNDLESFFDDLASLDSTNQMETRPQFMQNLGFAPDANMADLFSDFIPLQSSTFMASENAELAGLEHYGFYDPG
jgi:hypothetical protein